jgi:hypothetical protein
MRLDLYKNVDTETILKAIGLEENKIPRLRGVGIQDGKILVHTRTGGGNRDQYDSVEDFVSGEYGIEHYINEYKNKASWTKDVSAKERAKRIAVLEEQKAEVLATKAYTNEYMRDNAWFITDEDEEFDSTYANFWFSIPPELVAELAPLEDKVARAAYGDSKDLIDATIGGDEEAKKRIEKRIKEAEQDVTS